MAVGTGLERTTHGFKFFYWSSEKYEIFFKLTNKYVYREGESRYERNYTLNELHLDTIIHALRLDSFINGC